MHAVSEGMRCPSISEASIAYLKGLYPSFDPNMKVAYYDWGCYHGDEKYVWNWGWNWEVAKDEFFDSILNRGSGQFWVDVEYIPIRQVLLLEASGSDIEEDIWIRDMNNHEIIPSWCRQ
jgi:hypothetical protein